MGPTNLLVQLTSFIGRQRELAELDQLLSQSRLVTLTGAGGCGNTYLSHTCTECHGANLNGAPFGPPGQEVPTPNLTRGGELVGWSETDFITVLRTGVTPAGRQINDEMPWKYYGRMTDEELRALWLYLQSLPALEQGG